MPPRPIRPTIRYRSPSTAPGSKPLGCPGSESARRPTGVEEGGRRRAAAASEGVASAVGIRETELASRPHEEQKRADASRSAEQKGQRVKCAELYPSRRRSVFVVEKTGVGDERLSALGGRYATGAERVQDEGQCSRPLLSLC